MRRLRSVGLEFLQTAPLRLEFEGEVRAPPRAVFDAISGDPASWRSWFPGLSGGHYEGPPPYGVGSIREIRMSGTVYRETILAWEEPVRWVFRVDACTVPIGHALVEQWTVAERGPGAVVGWTFAIEPRPLFRAGSPLARPFMGWLFRRAMRNLERQLTRAETDVLPGE
jgi:Polyketide cyclase / dehydrase and lipid transport